jgi:hypothetical protein
MSILLIAPCVYGFNPYTGDMSNATNAARTIKCPKCDGRGRIEGFSHIETGKCFGCGGAKVIEVTHAPLSVRKRLVSVAVYELEACLEEARDYGDVSPNTLARVARALLNLCDTEKARELLANVARRGGPGLRRQIIETGREVNAA